MYVSVTLIQCNEFHHSFSVVATEVAESFSCSGKPTNSRLYQPMESSGHNCQVLKRGHTYTRGLLPLATMGAYRVRQRTGHDSDNNFKSRFRKHSIYLCINGRQKIPNIGSPNNTTK